MENKYIIVLFILIFTATEVCAGGTSIRTIVCAVLSSIHQVLEGIAAGLVTVMFVYGGIKYTFSADDPGGRKEGKNICIHSLVGGIIVTVARFIVALIGLNGGCI